VTGRVGGRTATLNTCADDVPGVIDDTSGEAMLILHMTKANAKK